MWNIAKEVNSAIARANFEISKLEGQPSINILNNIVFKYSKFSNYKFQLWDNLKDFNSVEDPEGWKKISEYLKDKQAILFFEWQDEKTMYLFQNGSNIVDILNDCHTFPFYITNKEAEYLLCHNDHDFLIACGKAKAWLKYHYDLS